MLIKKKPSLPGHYPDEASDEERQLLDNILKRGLSLASRERIWATFAAAKYVIQRNLPGDFVECGTWKGGHLLAAAHVFKAQKSQRSIYGFDTFESGFSNSPPLSIDRPTKTREIVVPNSKSLLRNFSRNFVNRAMLPNTAIQADVIKELDSIDMSSTARLVAGDVLKTLKVENNLPSEISILRLDTDFFESTLFELEVLFPRLVDGGILIIDDYGHWAGAQKAVHQYFEEHNLSYYISVIDSTGRLVIKA